MNCSNRKESRMVWNTSKPDGWKQYNLLSAESTQMEALAVNDNEDVSETMKLFQKAKEKIKYQSFEKIRITSNGPNNPELKKLYDIKTNIYKSQDIANTREEEIDEVEAKISEKLLEAQRKSIEKELEDIREAKKNGRCAAVFKLKAKVAGEKKETAEAIAIKDPVSGAMLYDHEEIKSASLNYCQNLLKDKKPDDEYR